MRAAPALAAGLSLAAAQNAGTTGVLVLPSAAETRDGPLTITGESLDALHPNGVDVLQVALGFESSVSLGQGVANQARFGALRVTNAIDAASPLLFRLLAEGTPLPEVQLFMRPTGATTDNLVLRFRPVFVSAIEGHTPPPPADDVEEIVSFLFESIDLTYVPQALSGMPGTPIQATWDQVHNTPTFAVG